MKGFLIAATKSGSGKTTLSLGIMASLVRRGFRVVPFKVGPDFIDPGHHTRVTGVDSRNLDGWMLSPEYNRHVFRQAAIRGADIAVVEGVMGLFDGYDGKSEAGSSAEMAKWLNLPVILVVDAKSMARSAAALVQGFERFDPSLKFMGVIFNNIGSNRHLEYLKEALSGTVATPCLGGIPRDERISIPERHLGLVTQDEHSLTEAHIRLLADRIDEHIDMEALLHSLPECFSEESQEQGKGLNEESALGVHRSQRVRIGIARDKAFCFYYQDNLDLLEENNATLVYFSPIADEKLPEELDGIYFGGGYPELFAKPLSQNETIRRQVMENSRKGMPIYAECGGFMYLCKALCDKEGNTFPMTGCFPFTTTMFNRLKSLGYREVELSTETILGPAGQTLRGHEFHYSEIDRSDAKAVKTVYRVAKRMGMERIDEGFQTNRTLGSYHHLHFGSQPMAARHFVESCGHYKMERRSP